MIGYKELKESIIPRYAKTTKTVEQIQEELHDLYGITEARYTIEKLLEAERKLQSITKSQC